MATLHVMLHITFLFHRLQFPLTKLHKHITLPTNPSPRFKIQDDKIGKDTLAGWSCIRLDRLRSGYRFVHLRDGAGMESKGMLLVGIQKNVV